jgi:hypothetical protein
MGQPLPYLLLCTRSCCRRLDVSFVSKYLGSDRTVRGTYGGDHPAYLYMHFIRMLLATQHSSSFVIQERGQCKVGQSRTYTPHMTVYLMNSLPRMPYIHRTCMVLALPKCERESSFLTLSNATNLFGVPKPVTNMQTSF